MSSYHAHAAASQPATVFSLGPALSLAPSQSASSSSTPGSSFSVSSSSSSSSSSSPLIAAATAASSPSYGPSAARPRSHPTSQSATGSWPRRAAGRRQSSRYELCVHARLNCSGSCRSEVTKSHRWQHAYRARHTGCDCRWRELRESGRRKKRAVSKPDDGDDAPRPADGTADDAAAGGTGTKDGEQAEECEEEELIEEIAPFDERARQFANPPRSPPPISASFVARNYVPLSLDTVPAHVLPTEPVGFSQLYSAQRQQQQQQQLQQQSYAAPPYQQQHEQQQQQLVNASQLAGGMFGGSTFSSPAPQPLVLPPAAQTATRSISAGPPTTATDGYVPHLSNTFLSFAAPASSLPLSLQPGVSLHAASPYGNPPGLALHSAALTGSYPPSGLQQQLSAVQMAAQPGGLSLSSLQLASLQAAIQQQQQQQQLQHQQPHKQLLPSHALLSQHTLSQLMSSAAAAALPPTMPHNPLFPSLHSLSSLPGALSLSGSAMAQHQLLQRSAPLYTGASNSAAPAASYGSLASHMLHPMMASPPHSAAHYPMAPFMPTVPTASPQLISLPPFLGLSSGSPPQPIPPVGGLHHWASRSAA